MLPQMQRLLVVLALLTLIYGNLAALPQSNLKRLLAYSSIAHAGYLLIGVVVVSRGRPSRFYLVAYLLMTLLSFAVLIVVAKQTGDDIEDFNGLAKRSPFLAFAMLVRDDFARGHSVHRRIFRQVFHLRRRHPAASDHAASSSA